MKKIGLIVSVLCLFIIGIVMSFTYTYTEQDAWDELLALGSNVTMDELIKKGYIDVSKVMNSPNDEISAFLRKAHNKESAVLRITNIIDGKLCAKILIYSKEYDVIKMWTMYPNQQQGEAPGKCFSTEIYEIEENGVINVFLKNVPDIMIPIEQEKFIDEILYSYKVTE